MKCLCHRLLHQHLSHLAAPQSGHCVTLHAATKRPCRDINKISGRDSFIDAPDFHSFIRPEAAAARVEKDTVLLLNGQVKSSLHPPSRRNAATTFAPSSTFFPTWGLCPQPETLFILLYS